MRVITGSAKGHRLRAPSDLGTRPMVDRVKEALFSVLEGYGPLRGRVLDLYAGSGAIGIECLSRGAAWADFVEQRAHVCRVIADNLAHTRLAGRARVIQSPVERFLATHRPQHSYDILMMDPPYADPHIPETITTIASSGLLGGEGVLIVGHSPRVTLEDGYGTLRRIKLRRLGDSCFSIYHHDRGAAGDA
jgi:16S rRNA (guanine(966)-N(2))-methyltransferase RsmD